MHSRANQGAQVQPPSTPPGASKRPAGRPKLDAAADLHERILRTALDEFLARGFGAASIEGIARAANVNKDTIYRQFGTKEQLYRESVAHGVGEIPRATPGALAGCSDAGETLFRIMRDLYRTFTSTRATAIASMSVTQAALFPDLAADARAESQRYLQPLTDYLRQLEGDGTLVLDDPREAAEMLAVVALGGVRFLFDQPLRGAALDEYITRRLRVFLRGWGHRPGPPAGPASGPRSCPADDPRTHAARRRRRARHMELIR